MWADFLQWWQSLWTDATIIGGAVAGLLSSMTMFLLGDIIWKTRVEKIKNETEFQQKQLNFFYAPLYIFYRESYARFASWKQENPDTNLVSQPFFRAGQDISFVQKIFSEHPGYASQPILLAWTDLNATDNKAVKQLHQENLVYLLIKEYHDLRRKLKLSYDKYELAEGVFKGIA